MPPDVQFVKRAGDRKWPLCMSLHRQSMVSDPVRLQRCIEIRRGTANLPEAHVHTAGILRVEDPGPWQRQPNMLPHPPIKHNASAVKNLHPSETGAVRQIAGLPFLHFGGSWKPWKQWKPPNFVEEPMIIRRPFILAASGLCFVLFGPSDAFKVR